MRTVKISLSIAAAAASTVLAAALLFDGGTAGPSPSTSASPAVQAPAHDGSHQRPAIVRSLAVVTKAEPAPTVDPDRMRGFLLEGKLPAGVVKATVLTDEDCAADAQGISHCRNRLRLPNGKTIEVRHPHRMHDVPCMTPGETVNLGRSASA